MYKRGALVMIFEDKYLKCQQYVDKLRTEYIEKHKRIQERDELIAENNIEARDIKGYHGREILELLQNADDAYQKSIDIGDKPDCDLQVKISYLNNVLRITNTGTFFDEDGIKAIVQGNNSTKSGKYIGNKGTGFRSVLNWANTVRIYSGDFNVEFSERIANECLSEIKDEEQIKKQLKRKPNLYIPMLAVPQNIENRKTNTDTTIEIEINPNKINDDYSVKKQISNIDLRILLFLPNISRIDITTKEGDITYKRKIIENNFTEIHLQKLIDDKVDIEETFYLFKKDIRNAITEDDTRKDIQLAIAVPIDLGHFENKHIYSFFPLLDTESPFNCVLHASYALGDHRNTVNVSEANKKIIQEQLLFLVEIANKFVKSNFHEIAYKMILPTNFPNKNWRFVSPFSKFEGIEEYYLDLVSKQKLFLTVNGENISINDNPMVIKDSFPKCFKGEKFKKLLKRTKDADIVDFIEFISLKSNKSVYRSESELKTIIDSISGNWSTEQQVEVFVWWNSHYTNELPKLLKTQNGSWINFKEECFFLIGDIDTQGLPSWVKIPALDKKYQKILFSISEENPKLIQAKEHDKEPQVSRVICQKNIYPTIDFMYRDSSNIISAVNSSVDTYNKAIDFVKWLWKNYRTKEDWTPPGRTNTSKFKYNFPSSNGNIVVDSEKTFFGSAYKNDLANSLFSNEYKEFPSADIFSINQNDMEAFRDFICKFGVKNFPAIEPIEVQPISSFDNEYKSTIKKGIYFGSSSYIANITYKFPYINNLENILENLSTAQIIDWIIKDTDLYSYISAPFYHKDAEIKYRGNLHREPRYYSEKIKNYILELFNETPWIELAGKRFAPRQILKNIDSKNNQKFAGIIPTLDTEILTTIANDIKTDFESIHKVFEKFDFADKVTDLSSSDFYGLLLKIPTLDFKLSSDLSKIIYRIIEQPSFKKEYPYSENKDLYLKKGLVLVNHQGKLKYYPAKDSYLPSSKIIIKKDVPIVEKGQRTNNNNFIKTFGCKEYNKEYRVIKESIVFSSANVEFQKYFYEFSKYARAYAENNENIERRGRKLTITLVSKIAISENEIIREIDEEYILISDTSTNWYITSFSSNFNLNIVSEIIETIYSNIANTPGFESSKLGELFRTKNNADREFLIKKDFGSLNVIEDEYYQNEIKNNFIETVKTLEPTYSIDKIEIDFENFNSLSNVPLIIALLKQIKCDVDKFKQAGFVYNLDLTEYHSQLLSDFIQKEKRNYANVIYTQAKNDLKLQNKYIETVREFNNYKFYSINNSIYFDVEKHLENIFGKWRAEKNILIADDEYSKNYEAMNPQKEFEEEIMNDTKAQQMIYFAKTEEFKKWLETNRNKLSEQHDSSVNPYEQYKDTVPTEKEVIFHPNNDKIEPEGKTHTNNGSFTHSASEKRRKSQKILGNIGEQLVYNLLCEKVGKNNVFPRSEAYVELGIIKPGQSVSGEYDISYTVENGVEYYVEVKTGDGKSFIISPGELQFAKNNPDRYKLFLVYNIDKETPDYTILPSKFWEDNRFRKTEVIERIEFNF